jgi:hypothetical protein
MAVEDDQKRVTKQIQEITRNMTPVGCPNTQSQGRGGLRVFLATHRDDNREQRGCAFTATAEDSKPGAKDNSKDNTWTHTPTGTRYLIPLPFCAKYTGNTITEDMIAASVETMVEIMAEEETSDGFAGVSIVEQALRNASGVRRPIKCSGCQGLAKYDQNAYHLWNDYPNKADQEVWKNFQTNLRRFREEKARRRDERQGQGSHYGPTEATAEPATLVNWQRLGFLTKAMSETIEAIADIETKPTVRRALLANLRSDLVNTVLEVTDPAEAEEQTSTKKNTKRRKRGPLILLYMKKDEQPKIQTQTGSKPVAMTMLAASQGKYPLRLAYNFPHLKFPIGDGQTTKDRAYLTGLLDTGGCCMMGKLEWYQELHKVCPQLFDDFFELAERKFEGINIGGLTDGIWLMHVAIFWMPYDERGATM